MSILMNKKLANKSLITACGKIQFSEEGTAEVEDSMAKKLATLKGFSIVGEEDSDEDAVDNETVDEEVTDDSYEESVDEEVEDAQEEQADEEIGEEESEDEETYITEEELQNMSVKQLEKYAKENGIDLGSATKKADIISAILGK